MNSKLMKASLAGAAAIALAAGGGTLAAWSDFYTSSTNHVGADVLALTVNPSATTAFDNVKLAPGQARDIAFYVASRNGVSVPQAGLTMTVKNLVGTEDGCDSNSEAASESGGNILDKTDPAAPCNNPASHGQFAQQALYYVQAAKVSDPSTCTTSTPMPTVQSNTKLSLMNDVPVNLLGSSTLAGGEGVCVLAHIFLPNNLAQYGSVADDASQGDQAAFNVRFDLSQI